MPAHEALLYGVTSALNAATLHTLDPHITSAVGSFLSSGWFDRLFGTGLNPLVVGPAKPQTIGVRPCSVASSNWWRRLFGSSSSSSGSTYGSGYSYAWLQALKGLESLQDLHLDMPLALPGQVGFKQYAIGFRVIGSQGSTLCLEGAWQFAGLTFGHTTGAPWAGGV
jgi:hypothetical protein